MMSISKHHGVPENQLSDSITLNQDNQTLLDHPSEKVWPIRRAVLFWVAVSATGWIAIYGFTSFLS